jgi:DNA-binding transcriptional ArsR family regulator
MIMGDNSKKDDGPYVYGMTEIPSRNDDLRPNDSKILDILGENNSSYTFSGIMRKIGMHQETLSRSLQRLYEQDLVEKSQYGYRLSTKGSILPRRARIKAHFTPILKAHLPSSVDELETVRNITGKWFKNLRWLGITENKDEHLLQWLDEWDLFQINLRITSNTLVIETSANNDQTITQSLICAIRIVQEMLKTYILHLDGTILNPTNNALAN